MCRRLAMEQSAAEDAPSAASAPSALAATNGASKIIGRNVNGTMVVTSAPSNEAELQLYRVMQRASLLAYYDTLLEMGGDDVQQLCDAGEEEFLEIMALVGMASKPLHVRRLQKALQEWVTNPAIFQIPIVPNLCPAENPFLACNQRFLGMAAHPIIQRAAVMSPENNRPMYSPSPGAPENSCGSNSSAANVSPVHAMPMTNSSKTVPVTVPSAPSNSSVINSSRSYSPVQIPACPTTASSGSSPSSVNCSPIQLTPSLLEVQIQRMALSAEKLCREYQLEPKPQNTKKKINKELDTILMMSDGDSRKIEEIRKYAAIYGRFDCKRKPEKPLTLHEVSVNEAAAQICRLLPALLTRRDELFILARKVVRHSGFYYSKGHTQIPSPCINRTSVSAERELVSGGVDGVSVDEAPAAKRGRPAQRQDYEDGAIANRSPESASRISIAHGSWWNRESRGLSTVRSAESDDADSRGSFSNSSSPPLQDPDENQGEESQDSSGRNRGVQCRDSRVRIVASSGDSIIAVANPALALSPALLPQNLLSPKPRPSNNERLSPIDN